MEKLSQKISALAVQRGWLEEEQLEWCVYALIKYMGTALFFSIILGMALFLHKLPETAVFSLTAYILRRRIGGWHAKTPFQCQLMSVGITAFHVLVFNPIIGQALPKEITLLLSLALSGLLIIAKPVYPKQLHFSAETMAQNCLRKNRIVFINGLLILVSYIAIPRVLTSFLSGLLVVLIGIAMEINISYGGKEHEQI